MPQIHSLTKDLPLFANKFEAFFYDRFPEKYTIVSIRNLILLDFLKSSGHADVGVGRDGWLYYYPINVLHAQINYPHLSRFNLEAWTKAFEAKRKFLAASGIKYLLFIVPEKATIYPEHFSSNATIRAGLSRLDEVQKNLSEKTSVDFIDLKKSLLNSKNEKTRLYKMYDAHWNFLGALQAAKLVGRHFQRYNPGATYFDLHDFPVEMITSYEGDLASALALSRQLPEQIPVVSLPGAQALSLPSSQTPYYGFYKSGSRAYSKPDLSLPSVFMIHDSFVRYYMMSMLAELCRISEFHWTQDFSPTKILEQKPDIFVEEMAERHLFDTEPQNVPDFVQIVSNTKNPNATIGDGAGHPALACYGDNLELVDMSVEKNADGWIAKLLWRSDSEQRLNRDVEIFVLDEAGHEIGKRHFSQDLLNRSVQNGQCWLDTVDLNIKKLDAKCRLGIVLIDSKIGLVPTQCQKTDWWSRRALLSADSLILNNKEFSQLFVLQPFRM